MTRRSPRSALLTIALAVALAGGSLPAASATARAQGCLGEAEPNDTPEQAALLSGDICVEGTLPEGDQDLAFWQLDAADAAARWTFELRGIPTTLTSLKLFRVVSPPGVEPADIERLPFLEVAAGPEGDGTAVVPDVLLPAGRFLAGISRSAFTGPRGLAGDDYTYRIAQGTPLPPSGDVEPNDVAEEAVAVASAFTLSGDLVDSIDRYAWDVPESAGRWALELQLPRGSAASLELLGTDGALIDSVRDESVVRSLDLELGPGSYGIVLSPRATESMPYILSATAQPADADAEPNDLTADAVDLADGVPTRGRLAGKGDRDRFALDVPEGPVQLRDVRLKWRSERERSICLIGSDDRDVLCRTGVGGTALQNLGLSPGRHVIEVRGEDDAADAYLLRVDVTSAAAPDFEVEPNQDIASATLLQADLGMRGRGAPQDHDVYRLPTTGQAQLWEIDLSGVGDGRLEWIRPSGSVLASTTIPPDLDSASLTDLYLVPGDHWFRVRGMEAEYALEATPLGPPDPDAEHEPNSEELRAERYRIGSRRVGRLPRMDDVDIYRFSLTAPQHIELRLDQPDDARTRVMLWHGQDPLADLAQRGEGEPLAYDLWLLPGDYTLELRPEQPSEGTYELTSSHLDPFRLAVDQEPNGGPTWAGTVPPSLAWSGSGIAPGDQDWFRLPELEAASELRLSVDDERARVRFVAGTDQVAARRDDAGSYVAEAVPPGVPIYVVITSDGGPYRALLEGPRLRPASDPAAELPVTLRWDATDDEVAAYWPQWQVVPSTLYLRNDGATDLEVNLATASSHHRWEAVPERSVVTLPSGSEVPVPVEIRVADDAWASEPVLLTTRVSDAAGSFATVSRTMSATAAATAVGSEAGWSIPDALRGGVNVALAGLGAAPGGEVNMDFEARLFDGVAPANGGFGSQVTDLPLDLRVDLAGDEPLPVAGIILDPQARRGSLHEVPRSFELLLSSDGQSWQTVLAAELSPLPVEQPFILDTPVQASGAMLRITSLYDDRPAYVALGEWKVVATPGTPPPGGPVDIAGSALGGHTVLLVPGVGQQTQVSSMLDEADDRVFIYLQDDPRFELVVGFHEGRAAQVTELGWRDPLGSKPEERLAAVDVEISPVGPLGPWTALGRWQLERDPDGSVAPFEIGDPVWARYVRLRGSAPPEARALELPATLRILERPTDDQYQTIIGEWGADSPAGPLEAASRGGLRSAAADDPDVGDDAATALPLVAGIASDGRVEVDVDEDWYHVDVPLGDDTLELLVSGQPTVRVSLELYDAAGQRRPMAFTLQDDGAVRYQAAVEPGAGYDLRVLQPPFSAVFTFDTSGSMGPFLDVVAEGIRSFAADVRAGREVVSIIPFEQSALLPSWEDDAFLLQGAVNAYPFDGSSSGAEVGLIDATQLLAEREGARAILVVTDAETSTYQRSAELWDLLARVRPIIFSVHVGGETRPAESKHLMQDWAASGGGYYTYPTTHAEMDRAFERMATWLRRPADYSLLSSTLNVGPSSLAVRGAAGDDGGPPGLAPGVGVEIILDTSASMLDKLEGRRRIDIAKDALAGLVGDALAEDVPIAIRTFGGTARNKKKAKQQSCRTRLSVPLQALEPDSLLRQIESLSANKQTRTPIADALAAVPTDLAELGGTRTIVLVTDGNETCGGDPAAVIEQLQAAGIDVTVNIVGFALDDEELKAQMAGWASLADGSYFDAGDAEALADSLARAVRAPFRVYGPDGAVFDGGSVDGEPITIDAGTYRVEVLTDPSVVFDEVVVGAGESVTLTLPATE